MNSFDLYITSQTPWKDLHFKVLDPNTYSLAPLHYSLRNIVVRFCVRNLVLNLFIILEVFKA